MKYMKIIPLLIASMFMSGCWDRIEINEKRFISTIGIDTGKDIGKQEELRKIKSDEPFRETNIDKLHMIFSSPDMSELGPGKSPAVKDNNIIVDSYSVQDGVYKANSKSSRSLQFGHTKLLLLSNELMLHPDVMKEIIDYFQRQPALNRMMYIAVVDGKTENFIKYQSKGEPNIESYFTGLMENTLMNATILPVTLNEFLMLVNENGNAILPRLIYDKEHNDIRLSGVSVIKNYKIVGNLSPNETSDIEILRGKIKGGKKVIYRNGHPVDYKIDSIKRKIRLVDNEEKLEFNVNIELEGRIMSNYPDEDIFSKNILNEIEENFNKALSEECEKVIKTTQQEFDVDVIGIREYLYKFHPSVWNKVKNNWDVAYKSAIINVNINTQMRRIGTTK